MTIARRAVFLDKDGTLVEDVPYNVDPRLVRLGPGALSGLARLRDAGYALFVVSNQSGVARGHFPEAALSGVERRLRELLGDARIELDGFAYCPHLPGADGPLGIACVCRKPSPGLVLDLARAHGLDLAGSWFVGDILDDVECGHRAGCRTILLDNGHETEWRSGPDRVTDAVAADLDEAASIILGEMTRLPAPVPVVEAPRPHSLEVTT